MGEIKKVGALLKFLTGTLTITFTILLFTETIFAHGGFQKQSGSVVVDILQDPISPLVGEKVKMYFTIRDEAIQPKNGNLSEQNLVNLPVTLSVIDTYTGDASRDELILKKEIVTNVNGAFNFEYVFNKENYFDIELDFLDKNGQKQEVGFLIQPRQSGPVVTRFRNLKIPEALLSLVIGIVSTIIVIKQFRLEKIINRMKKFNNNKKKVTKKL